MTRCGLALACLAVTAMPSVEACRAGVWDATPVVGLLGDYATNPALLDLPHTAEAHGALLLDSPTTYHGDGFALSLSPRFRVGDSPGYSTTTSDYARLDGKAEWDSERSAFSVAGGVAQDSTLYHDYTFNGSSGVRRDTVNADVDWNRLLTEHISVSTDLNASRVRYGESAGAPTLTDYSYSSFSPVVAWNETDRNRFTLAVGAGLYKSLDGTTRSTNANLQLGFVRQLSEIWTATAATGYSRAFNRINIEQPTLVFTPQGLGIELVERTFKSDQNGTVFSLSLARQSNRLGLTVTASRQLVPSGFAFLSTQQAYEVTASYLRTARWTLSGDARYVKSQNPSLTSGAVADQTVKYAGLTSAWQWTEFWTVSVSAARIEDTLQASSDIRVVSTEVSVELARRFKPVRF